MHRLTRTVRFNLTREGLIPGGENGEGGKPPMEGFGRHYAFETRCIGTPHPDTGYLINIKEIDHAVREGVIPLIARAVERGDDPAAVMGGLLAGVAALLPVRVESVGLWLTPHLLYEMFTGNTESGEDAMDDTSNATNASRERGVVVRQMFEFSAAHRLHVPSLSDAENERIFGKCNNPGGHGHNYRIEPAVEIDPDRPMGIGAIERITNETVIERFDHKHLNDQTEEFATGTGLNPSAENIARVCFGLLQGPIGAGGGRLRAITVWETDRTSCTYPGRDTFSDTRTQ